VLRLGRDSGDPLFMQGDQAALVEAVKRGRIPAETGI
jgi:hypothetical protein